MLVTAGARAVLVCAVVTALLVAVVALVVIVAQVEVRTSPAMRTQIVVTAHREQRVAARQALAVNPLGVAASVFLVAAQQAA
jgi:hypothetical protein